MTEQVPMERLISSWMADEAGVAPDQVLDQILTTTASIRPRPRLWAVVVEPRMRSRTMPVAVGLANRRLVLAVVLAILAVALAAAVVGASLLLNRIPSDTAADWPGFRGSADHGGLAAEGPVGNPVLAWQFHASGAVLEVAVVGERVFFAGEDGRLYAVSRTRGFQLWSVQVGEPPITGPYATGGRLFVVDAAGTVHAFAQDDGAPLWSSSARYVGASRPIAADGTLYFGTQDGFVVAMDAATGTERWRLPLPGAAHANAPAFADGLLYVGTDGAGYVAIDVATRQIAWTGSTDDDLTGTAVVAEGIAYIGVGSDARSGTLRAFDAKTGRQLWTATDPLLESPAVVHGVAYTSTFGGLVAAIDTATGVTRWRVQLTGEIRPPVVSGGVVYVLAGNEHRVYAVDAATGGKLWQFDLDAYGNCCLSVAHGAVYVGLRDGSVEAISGDGAALTARPFPSLPATIAPSTSPPSVSPSPAPPASIGTIVGTTDLAGHDFGPISQIAIDPSGRVWAPEAEAGKIAILDPSGTLLEEWSAPADSAGPFDFSRGNGDGYGTLAFAKDGSFYVLDVGNLRVQAFDSNRRFIRAWGAFGKRPGEFADPVGIAVAPDGTIWVLDEIRSVIEHYRPDGKVIGSFDPFVDDPINDGANSLAIDPAGNLYVSMASPAKILVFDGTGKRLRVIGDGAFDEQASDLAIDADGRIFVTQGPQRGDAPGVLAFAPDGTLLGGFGPPGHGDGQLDFPAGIALDGKGGLYVEDSEPASARLVHLELLPGVTR